MKVDHDLNDAIDTLARYSLWAAYERWVESGWEQIPEVGMHDFDRIVERMAALLPKDAPVAEYETAYELLENRVNGGSDE